MLPATRIDSSISSLNDKELIIKIVNKDQKAFLELYKRYHQYVFNFVFLIVRDFGEVEHIVQEVFFQLWNKAYTFKGNRASLSTWIITIARNRAFDKLRRLKYSKQTLNIDDLQIKSDSLTLNILISQKNSLIIRKAINDLPEEQKNTITIVYFEGFTHAEAALKLDVPLGTIKTRLRLGIVKLRNLIQEKIVNEY